MIPMAFPLDNGVSLLSSFPSLATTEGPAALFAPDTTRHLYALTGVLSTVEFNDFVAMADTTLTLYRCSSSFFS